MESSAAIALFLSSQFVNVTLAALALSFKVPDSNAQYFTCANRCRCLCNMPLLVPGAIPPMNALRPSCA
jgi:hypothetical protein